MASGSNLSYCEKWDAYNLTYIKYDNIFTQKNNKHSIYDNYYENKI